MIIPVEPGAHQQLLEQLWGLRQSIETARINTRRHQVVAGAFWGAGRQGWRFNVQEALVVEVVVHGLEDLTAGDDGFLHFRPAQVQITILELGFLSSINAISNIKWRGLGLIQNLRGLNLDFDFSGFHLGIDGFRRPRSHGTGGFNYIFAPHGVGHVQRVLPELLGEHQLHDAGAVA